MDGRQWSTHAAVVADGDLAAVEAALAACGFTAYAVASRSDGRHDLTCYGEGGRLPPAAAEALAGLGVRLRGGAVASERELLAGCLPEDPVELAPGWWIDHCGRLGADHPGRVLRVPPSTAFGDGHHPTTRMAAGRILGLGSRAARPAAGGTAGGAGAAADAAGAMVRPGAPAPGTGLRPSPMGSPPPLVGVRVLDLGCGTGVLGLVAALRGAQVDLTDIDPAAVAAADALLRAHGIADHRAAVADLLTGVPGAGYGAVIANIYADLLLDLLADPRLTAILPAGTLILSGIAEAKSPAVEAALARAGFALRWRGSEAWWVCIEATR